MTYGDVAELMGRGSPRTVGAVMSDHGREVPWQRVVQASGRPAEPYLQEALRAARRRGLPDPRRAGGPGGGALGRDVRLTAPDVAGVVHRRARRDGPVSDLRGGVARVAPPPRDGLPAAPYRLVRAPRAVPRAFVPDAEQARVLDHAGGPLLVLAGPGTGKTATMVEAVARRVEAGLAPERVLVLTFSRKAAQELRERLAARLGRTTRGALAMTFHSYAFALLRRELAAAGGPPLRLLSGPEQDLEVARLLAGEVEDGGLDWPEPLRPALPLRGFRRELRDLLQRAQERGVDGAVLSALGEAAGRPEWAAAGRFLDAYEGRFALDPSAEVLDHSGLVRAAAGLLETDDELRAREREARAVVFVDEYQDSDPAQVRLLQALAGEGRDLVAVGDPDQSIYAFRGADVRGILDLPRRVPDGAGRAGARRGAAHRPAVRSGAAGRQPRGRPAAACGWADAGLPRPAARPGRGAQLGPGGGAARVVADGGGGAGGRRPAPGPPARRAGLVADGGAAALDPALAGRPAARAARRRAYRSGCRPTRCRWSRSRSSGRCSTCWPRRCSPSS